MSYTINYCIHNKAVRDAMSGKYDVCKGELHNELLLVKIKMEVKDLKCFHLYTILNI